MEFLQQGIETWSQLPGSVSDLAARFASSGYEFSLVGGPVRDALLGREIADLDFTTSAPPEASERLLADWGQALWTIGREFGTVGAQRDGVSVEVTTYRSDSYQPKSRKPSVAFGTCLDGDLARRDFTVNAMAVRLPDLTFVDPYQGLRDLTIGVLRTPITPVISFGDDPLRMLRAARFAAQLGFAIEPATAEAICELAPRLEIISAERIQAELTKLLLALDPTAGLTVLVDSGMAEYVLPELPALQLEIDEHHHHKDVYQHSLKVLEQAIAQETGPDGPVPAPDLVLRLAALLHDVGKPATRRFEADGGVSFHGHEVVGARLVRSRLRALRFDKQIVRDVSRLVELHLRFHGYGEGAWTDSAVRRYVTDAGSLLERLHRLTRADCTTRNRRKAQRLWEAYADLEHRIAALREQEAIDAIRPDLDGHQIMEILGIPAGPLVGKAYHHLLALRMEQGPLAHDDAVAELRRWFASVAN